MQKKVLGAVAGGAAVVGLIVFGAGTASASDPTCLNDSVSNTVADPAGVTAATLADPAGTLQADVACAHEVLGH